MLRRPDMQYVLVDETALTDDDPDGLAGPFAHIVVDEAQELTDAEWQMLLRALPVREFHDRRRPSSGPARFTESWQRAARARRNRSSQRRRTDASTTGRRKRSWPRPNR